MLMDFGLFMEQYGYKVLIIITALALLLSTNYLFFYLVAIGKEELAYWILVVGVSIAVAIILRSSKRIITEYRKSHETAHGKIMQSKR